MSRSKLCSVKIYDLTDPRFVLKFHGYRWLESGWNDALFWWQKVRKMWFFGAILRSFGRGRQTFAESVPCLPVKTVKCCPNRVPIGSPYLLELFLKSDFVRIEYMPSAYNSTNICKNHMWLRKSWLVECRMRLGYSRRATRWTSRDALLGWRCARSHISSPRGKDYNGEIHYMTTTQYTGRYVTWHLPNLLTPRCPCAMLGVANKHPAVNPFGLQRR